MVSSAPPETELTNLTSSEPVNWTLVSIHELRSAWWIYMRRLTENSPGHMVITFSLDRFKSLATLVMYTGAQMSALQTEVATHCGTNPDKKKARVTNGSGKSQLQ